MPCIGYEHRRVNVAALEAHLRSKGLTPQSRKWSEVWQRKKHKFFI